MMNGWILTNQRSIMVVYFCITYTVFLMYSIMIFLIYPNDLMKQSPKAFVYYEQALLQIHYNTWPVVYPYIRLWK